METRRWITTQKGLCGLRLSADSTVQCEPCLNSMGATGTSHKPESNSESSALQVLWGRKRFQQIVLEQMCMVGWDNIRSASLDFFEITMDVSTICSPNEALVVVLNESYPIQCPAIRSSSLRFVPAPVGTDFVFSLVDIRNAFMRCMIHYERLTQALRLIDEQAVTRTSDAPSNHNHHTSKLASSPRTDTTEMQFVPISTQRMVLVQQHPQVWATVSISLDVKHPGERCEVAFSGPTEWRRRYEERWGHRRHNWDKMLSILRNLESILEVNFASSAQGSSSSLPTTASADLLAGTAYCGEVSATDCSICYSNASGNATSQCDSKASTGCCNERCVHVYHADCVRKWLSSLSTCKISFGTMYGVCPYCASELHVPV